MIGQKIASLRRAVWTWHQPLTCIPAGADSPISDLFVWRSSEDWQTFFELIDIPSLFEDNQSSDQVTLIFFDGRGNIICEKLFNLMANYRQTLDISGLIGRNNGDSGTFAVFHSKTPTAVTKLGSFLAERGYVSYCYRNAPLMAYVHGNYDAISRGGDGELQMLGGTSFLNREYRLQYEFQSGLVYELGMVNPTPFMQYFTCKFFSVLTGKLQYSQNLSIAAGGIELFAVTDEKIGPLRLVIKSQLVMARPIVFRIQNRKLDVFHG
jgi:hypothetical protein